MFVSEIVGKNKTKLTAEEIDCIINTEIKQAYIYKKGNEFYTFCIFTDGSVTKINAKTDKEVGSSVEEMERLKEKGFEIEDVTDEYVLD